MKKMEKISVGKRCFIEYQVWLFMQENVFFPRSDKETEV